MIIGLYITSLEAGGAERVVSRLSRILSRQGHTVYVILSDIANVAYSISGELINLGISSDRSSLKKVSILLNRVKSLKRIKIQNKIDVIISFLDGANTVNALSLVKNTRSFVSIRNHQSSEIKNASASIQFLYRILMGTIYRRSSGVICVSQAIASDIYNTFRVPLKKNFSFI